MNLIKRIYRSARHRFVLAENLFRFQKSRDAMRAYHNKFRGKRCFIIGNGPSLRKEDLEILNNEITFASHGIYYLFKETDWRPTFYCAQDAKLICERYREIEAECHDILCFFALVKNLRYPRLPKKSICVELDLSPSENEGPKFSVDLCKCVYEGFTVTYFSIQLAIYMGFSEIYLLGVDHNYSISRNPDGTINVDKTAGDHFYKIDTLSNIPQTYKSTMAYDVARKYADENGIKILNATRGGKLEIFERVDFDSLCI